MTPPRKPHRRVSATTEDSRRVPREPSPGSRRKRIVAVTIALLVVGGLYGTRDTLQTWLAPAPPTTSSPRVATSVRSRTAEHTRPEAVVTNASARPTSPFLNTDPSVQYVGSDACRQCHEEHATTFQHTGMGRSMDVVQLDREPPDGGYDHAASQRHYEVRRRDGQLWHRELLITEQPEEVLLAEYPMKYVVGSGRHSLTYVYEDDGFLMESPITWYASRQAWDMSPGYNHANHNSFERAAPESCLVCHAGRIESLDGSLHRLRVHEATIGCEQCHGPGELHIQKHSLGNAASREPVDKTIVNPKHLSRDLALAVCSQCHLRGQARIARRGMGLQDFRPGLPFDAFWLVYRLEPPDQNMTVVGHVEQMMLSKCFQKSETFSCATCHSPHDSDPPRNEPERYNKTCAECHRADDCQEVAARREPVQDNCIQCHMPSSETDIPHLAFTHHRVAVHSDAGRPNSGDADSEVPSPPTPAPTSSPDQRVVLIDGQTDPGGSESARALGLAYLEFVIGGEGSRERAVRFNREAMRLLHDYRETVDRDGMVDSWLARLHANAGYQDAGELAARALADPRLAGIDRSNALFLLAETRFAHGDYARSLEALAELHTVRRHSLQWLLQAQCEKNLGRESDMLRSLHEAVRINPGLKNIQQFLAEHYRQRGELKRAEYHSRRAPP